MATATATTRIRTATPTARRIITVIAGTATPTDDRTSTTVSGTPTSQRTLVVLPGEPQRPGGGPGLPGAGSGGGVTGSMSVAVALLAAGCLALSGLSLAMGRRRR